MEEPSQRSEEVLRIMADHAEARLAESRPSRGGGFLWPGETAGILFGNARRTHARLRARGALGGMDWRYKIRNALLE